MSYDKHVLPVFIFRVDHAHTSGFYKTRKGQKVSHGPDHNGSLMNGSGSILRILLAQKRSSQLYYFFNHHTKKSYKR